MSTGGVTIPVNGITIVDGMWVGREGLRLTGGITVFDTGACVCACGGCVGAAVWCCVFMPRAVVWCGVVWCV